MKLSYTLAFGLLWTAGVFAQSEDLLSQPESKLIPVMQLSDWTLYYDVSKLKLAENGFTFNDPLAKDDYDATTIGKEVYNAYFASDFMGRFMEAPRTRYFTLLANDIFNPQYNASYQDLRTKARSALEIFNDATSNNISIDLALSKGAVSTLAVGNFKVKFVGNFAQILHNEKERKANIVFDLEKESGGKITRNTFFQEQSRMSQEARAAGQPAPHVFTVFEEMIEKARLTAFATRFLPNFLKDAAYLLPLTNQSGQPEIAKIADQWETGYDAGMQKIRRHFAQKCRDNQPCWIPGSYTLLGSTYRNQKGELALPPPLPTTPKVKQATHVEKLKASLRNTEEALEMFVARHAEILMERQELRDQLSERLLKKLDKQPPPPDLGQDREYIAKQKIIERLEILKMAEGSNSGGLLVTQIERDVARVKLNILSRLARVVSTSKDPVFQGTSELEATWYSLPAPQANDATFMKAVHFVPNAPTSVAADLAGTASGDALLEQDDPQLPNELTLECHYVPKLISNGRFPVTMVKDLSAQRVDTGNKYRFRYRKLPGLAGAPCYTQVNGQKVFLGRVSALEMISSPEDAELLYIVDGK